MLSDFLGVFFFFAQKSLNFCMWTSAGFRFIFEKNEAKKLSRRCLLFSENKRHLKFFVFSFNLIFLSTYLSR